MRRVKKEDLKVGAVVHWHRENNPYIIESVSLNEVKFRGYKPEMIHKVLKYCFIDTKDNNVQIKNTRVKESELTRTHDTKLQKKSRIESMFNEIELGVMRVAHNPLDDQLATEYRSKKAVFIEELKRLEALDAK